MVLPLLGKLSSGAIRSLARNLFSGFYERGISANRALLELREQGLGYRRTDFLADFRVDRPGYDRSTSIRRVGADIVPRDNLLKPQYHGVPDRYSLVFKGVGFDSETGEASTQYFYMHRNSLDTRSNMEGDAAGWMSEQSSRYGFDISEVSIVDGYINPVWEGYE